MTETKYEVRYEDKNGRYTEETFTDDVDARIRLEELNERGIDAEVWEVQRGPERRIDK